MGGVTTRKRPVLNNSDTNDRRGAGSCRNNESISWQGPRCDRVHTLRSCNWNNYRQLRHGRRARRSKILDDRRVHRVGVGDLWNSLAANVHGISGKALPLIPSERNMECTWRRAVCHGWLWCCRNSICLRAGWTDHCASRNQRRVCGADWLDVPWRTSHVQANSVLHHRRSGSYLPWDVATPSVRGRHFFAINFKRCPIRFLLKSGIMPLVSLAAAKNRSKVLALGLGPSGGRRSHSIRSSSTCSACAAATPVCMTCLLSKPASSSASTSGRSRSVSMPNADRKCCVVT